MYGRPRNLLPKHNAQPQIKITIQDMYGPKWTH